MKEILMSSSQTIPSQAENDDFKTMRRSMIDSQLRPNAIEEQWILSAMGKIAREDYVSQELRNIAYMDRSISLGKGRFLAPPLTSALMLQKAQITKDDNILYIGSGTGYNVAVAASRAAFVTALDSDIENIAAGENINILQGPLNEGAVQNAPYSLIIIEGAIEQVPRMISDQLADNGRLVCGVIKNNVSQLCIGYKCGDTLALVAFMECEIEGFSPSASIGFSKEKEFSF